MDSSRVVIRASRSMTSTVTSCASTLLLVTLTEGVDRGQKRVEIRRRHPDGHVGGGVFATSLNALALQLALEICCQVSDRGDSGGDIVDIDRHVSGADDLLVCLGVGARVCATVHASGIHAHLARELRRFQRLPRRCTARPRRPASPPLLPAARQEANAHRSYYACCGE